MLCDCSAEDSPDQPDLATILQNTDRGSSEGLEWRCGQCSRYALIKYREELVVDLYSPSCSLYRCRSLGEALPSPDQGPTAREAPPLPPSNAPRVGPPQTTPQPAPHNTPSILRQSEQDRKDSVLS